MTDEKFSSVQFTRSVVSDSLQPVSFKSHSLIDEETEPRKVLIVHAGSFSQLLEFNLLVS